MTADELKKLADDLTFHGRYGHEAEEQASMRRVKRNAEASAAILKLLAINAELVEALKLCAAVCAGETLNKSSLIRALEKARPALAKAEGGEL